jgi:hypothetical protein
MNTHLSKLRLLAFFTILFCYCLVSCNTSTDKKKNLNPEDSIIASVLKGQVYTYAPELDTTTYQAVGYCDCCSGNHLFIDDSIFVTIDLCEASASYSKGKYIVENGRVTLQYDTLLIERTYTYGNEADTTGTLEGIYSTNVISNKNPATIVLNRLNHHQNVCFDTGVKELGFVTLDKKALILGYIDQLKADSVFDKLGL